MFKIIRNCTGRIWSVPAIHGDLDQLVALHDGIYDAFERGDHILYHGNYIGYGVQSAACIDEILTFRRLVMSIEGVRPDDLTYLKGSQEDLWQRLSNLAYLPNANDMYLWMLANGVAETLASYGISHLDGIEACQLGSVGLSRWTKHIHQTVRNCSSHAEFYTMLKRAAYTDARDREPMLFVHTGLDHRKPLDNQGDALYWGASLFQGMQTAYAPFGKVVRGFDPERQGTEFNCIKATIDDGCGFGGGLTTAGFMPDGTVETVLSTA